MSKDTKVDTEEKVKEVVVDKVLKALKAKADLLGISYHPNISVDKLKAKVDLHLKKEDVVVNKVSVGIDKTIEEAEAKARKPITVTVTDLNAATANDLNMPINVGNKYFKVGAIITKGIEQDVPSCIVEYLKAKTMVKFVDEFHPITKRPTGNKKATVTKQFALAYK